MSHWSDPWDNASEPEPEAEKREARVWKVAEITREIRTRLEGLGRVRVEGEVAGLKRATSGHLYFALKDIDAKIDCTIWKSQTSSALRFDLREGMAVVASGRLDVYAPRGTYSLNVSRLEQAGLGSLLARLEELKARLKQEGWFERHRPLPRLPRMIGVVTSRDGAALQDFLRTRTQRWPLYPVRLAHTSVQGAAAAVEIAAAIERLDASGVDVICVIRGGGSLEDLWAFNELPVLEAIRRARVPVVSGVGHETDSTLADLVADQRAHTPTDAAQTVIPDRRAYVDVLDRAANHLGRAIDDALQSREQRIARIASSPALRSPEWILERRETKLVGLDRALRAHARELVARAASRVDAAGTRLSRQDPAARLERLGARLERASPRLASGMQRPLDEAARRLDLARRALETISPLGVLERGYSITRRIDGAAVRDAAQLVSGEMIETSFARGSSVSRVESTKAS